MKKFIDSRTLISVFVLFIGMMLTGCATTQLGAAAVKGDIKEMETLLNQGVDVNEKGRAKATPLYEAVVFDAPIDAVRFLLEKGADVNQGKSNGWKPIHVAVKQGKADLVKLLLDRGADINVRNPRGKTPLQIAEGNGDTVIIQMLKEAGENRYRNRSSTPMAPKTSPLPTALPLPMESSKPF